MPNDPQEIIGQNDGPAMALLRRYSIPICGALALAGDAVLWHRGAFNNDENVRWGAYDLMAGAGTAAFGGPKPIITTLWTAGGVENLVSGIHQVATSGLDLDTGMKVAFALAWSVAPVAMFYGNAIAEEVRHSRPYQRLAHSVGVIDHALQSSPVGRFIKNQFLSDEKQVGAGLYGAAAVVVAGEGVDRLCKAVTQQNPRTKEDALIGLGISALFIASNLFGRIKQATAAEPLLQDIPRAGGLSTPASSNSSST